MSFIATKKADPTPPQSEVFSQIVVQLPSHPDEISLRPTKVFASIFPSLEEVMSDKKNFVLIKNGADSSTVFSSKQPRGAALKAANRDHTDIRLRERGTDKIHVFTGERKRVPAPENAPSWVGDMVWKANVKKIGIERA